MGNDCGTHIIGIPGQTGEKYYTGPVFDCAVEYSVPCGCGVFEGGVI